MYVCICMNVTSQDIQDCYQTDANSVEEIMEKTGAGTCCGSCQDYLEMMIQKIQSSKLSSQENIHEPE